MLKLDMADAGLNQESDAGVLDFHSTRHTFATRLAESGVSDREIMEVARLSSSSLALRYSHPSRSHQQSVVDRLTPPPVLAASEVRGRGMRVVRTARDTVFPVLDGWPSGLRHRS
jgi:Phage integrase family